MTEIITLQCPSCGGKLEITPDMTRLYCMHCGQEQIVLQKGETYSLHPLQEAISVLSQATARNASEQAIRRIQGEIIASEEQEKALQEKIENINKLIEAHKKRDQELRFIWRGPILIILFFLGYVGITALGKNHEIFQAIRNFMFAPFICWSVIIILIVVWIWTIGEAIFGTGPSPSRKEAEGAHQNTELEIEALRSEKRKMLDEISHHKEIVKKAM